jgi:hypothetical protein
LVCLWPWFWPFLSLYLISTTLPGFAYSSALKMAAGFTKTLVTVCQTVCQHIPEESDFHSGCCENLWSHISRGVCVIHTAPLWVGWFTNCMPYKIRGDWIRVMLTTIQSRTFCLLICCLKT